MDKEEKSPTQSKSTQIQPAVAGQPVVDNAAPTGVTTAAADSSVSNNLATAPIEEKRELDRPRPPARQKRQVRKKRSKLRWLIPLLIVLIAAGIGYYFWQGNQGPKGFQGTTTVANSRTPVTLTVSASGQISAKSDLALTFGSSGTVTEIDHQEGDTVKKGDVLAKIDPSTLNNQVETAKAQLSSAQANLDKVKAGATPQQIQQQEDAVKQAELKYQQTVNGDALAIDVQSAQAQLASAQAKLQQDEAGGTAAQKAQAASSLASAQVGLQSAQAKLQQDQQGGTPAQKAQAQSAVTSAQSNLESAQAKYQSTLAGPDAATVEQAQATYDEAVDSLNKTQSQLQSALQSSSSAKQEALDALNTAQDSYANIYASNRNADGTLKSNLTSAQTGAETDAYRALQDAQAKYNQANSAYNDAQVQLQQGVASAQEQVTNALAQLNSTKAGPTQSDITAAKASVDQAQASLQSAQASLAALTATSSQIASDQASVAQAQASIQSANASIAALAPTSETIAADQASVASAQANLDKLTHPSTQSDIDIAQSQLDSAKAALTALTNDPTLQNNVATAQAQVDEAQAAYDTAKLNLNNAVITAPFDGVISSDNSIQVGQQVTASTAVFQLTDPSELHVDVNVGEADISKIQLNMPVAINLDAISGKSFTGKVTFISPKATVSNNVVIYVVTVTLDSGSQNSLLTAYPSLQTMFQRGQTGATGTASTVISSTNTTQGQAPTGITNTNSTTGGSTANGSNSSGATRGGFAGGGATGASSGICGWTPSFGQATSSNAATTPKVGETANVTVCLSLQVPTTGQVAVPNRAIKTKVVTDASGQRQAVKYVTVLLNKDTNQTVDKQVTTGLVGDTYTLVTAGLNTGDVVVTSSGATTSTSSTRSSTSTNNSGNPFGGAGGAGGPPGP